MCLGGMGTCVKMSSAMRGSGMGPFAGLKFTL